MPSLAEILSADIVDTYADKKAQKAFMEMKRHHDGGGCQCPNCMKISVSEWNSWVRYFIEDEDTANLYLSQVYLNRNGRLGILMGFKLD